MNRAIAWFAHNPVAANLLMALLLISGLLALPALRLEVFPEPSPDLVTISVEYRGAAPQEVEEGVCMRIEEALQGLVGIERVTSTASEGLGVVSAELLPGEDLSDLADEIKARVDAIDTFPEETEKPVVSRAVLRRSVIDVALSGHAEEAVLKELAEQVRNEIIVGTDATLVDLAAVRPYEISIEVSERALRRYGLRFDDVATAVRRSSLDLPAGSLDTVGGEILLRAKGQAYRGDEFARIPVVTRPDGSRVLLADVATVIDGFEQTDRWSHFDGEPAVLLQVFRVGDQSAPTLAEQVKQYAREALARMPEGIRLTTWQDDSEYFRGRLDMLVRNGRAGLLLVLLILAIFMRLRLAAWVALGLPVSILGAIALMPPFDLSVNIVSLFAFILVLGILVDDAIVVGENVWVHRQRTADPLRAAIEGTREVSVPVAFAVLTSITAFSPLLFLPGTFGQIFFALPVVVIACFAFSVLESLLILPSHLAHTRTDAAALAEGDRVGRWRAFQERVNGGLDRIVREIYRPRLERLLGARYLVVAIATAALLVSLGAVAGGWIRFTFFPEVEAENVAALVTMPLGTPVERTGEAVAQLDAAAARLRAELEPADGPGERVFRHVLTSVGAQPYLARQFSGPGGAGSQRFTGSHLGEVNVELTPSEDRETRAEDVVKRWRELAGPIPDVVELVFTAARFSAGDAIDVQLRGPDTGELRVVAEELKRELVR
ncbi:MAG: efflux RND transporter permease subunit, partial [Myxococcota bacterium]